MQSNSSQNKKGKQSPPSPPSTPTTFSFGHKRSLSVDFEVEKRQRMNSDCSGKSFEVISSPESIPSGLFEPIIDLDIITNEMHNLEKRNSMALAQSSPSKSRVKNKLGLLVLGFNEAEVVAPLSLAKNQRKGFTFHEFLLCSSSNAIPEEMTIPRNK